MFNAVIFHGKQVIKPEDLTERDTDVSGIIQFKDYQKTLERTRDVVKKIHYAMPLRTMLYDSLGYLKEYQEITKIVFIQSSQLYYIILKKAGMGLRA